MPVNPKEGRRRMTDTEKLSTVLILCNCQETRDTEFYL